MKTLSHIKKAKQICLVVAICLVLLCVSVTPTYAAQTRDIEIIDGSSSDVLIDVIPNYSTNYRYSCDIVFLNMRFKYNLFAIATNEETEESYVNSGTWLINKYPINEVPLTVTNHADTPIKVSTQIDSPDFEKCGIDVIKNDKLNNEILDACKLTEQGAVISESTANIALEGYPNINKYKGKKEINVVVKVKPTSGYTTNGSYFEYTS